MRGNAHYLFIYNVIFQDIAAHREPKVHSSQQRNLYATYFSGGEIAFVHPYSSKVSFLDRSQCRFRAFEGLHFSNAIKVNFKPMTTLRGLLAQLGQNLKSSAKK